MNLGHHTRALSKRADPWSRDLETGWIKVGGTASHDRIISGQKACVSEDDNLHLNFEPMLSRLMGPQREGDENSARALHLICYIFPYVFPPKTD